MSLLTDVNGVSSAVSAHVLRDLENAQPPPAEFASVRPSAVTYASDDETSNVPANVVTSSYFSLLGAAPARANSSPAPNPTPS